MKIRSAIINDIPHRVRFFNLSEISSGISKTQVREIILGWCTNIFPTFYIVLNRAVNQESIFNIIDIAFYRRLADCRMFYAFRSCSQLTRIG